MPEEENAQWNCLKLSFLVTPKSMFLVTQLIWSPDFRKQGDTLWEFMILKKKYLDAISK